MYGSVGDSVPAMISEGTSSAQWTGWRSHAFLSPRLIQRSLTFVAKALDLTPFAGPSEPFPQRITAKSCQPCFTVPCLELSTHAELGRVRFSQIHSRSPFVGGAWRCSDKDAADRFDYDYHPAHAELGRCEPLCRNASLLLLEVASISAYHLQIQGNGRTQYLWSFGLRHRH